MRFLSFMSSPTSTTRPPVVTVVGHIDHGKSSLLDYIRKANVVDKEAGGITQHIAAYEAVRKAPDGTERSITFIDTPGHEAFKQMRVRGAKVADVVILIVSAEDGVKPQTLEAYNAIKEAQVPFIVAFTKIDKPNANIEQAKNSLLQHEMYLEGVGGDIPWVGISSKTGEGIDDLLDLVLLTADMKGLSCNMDVPATGIVIESNRDAKKGVSATLLVREGTLTKGSFIVAGGAWAPVRIVENFAGKPVESICAGSPARIIGFSAIPPVGEQFVIVKTKREAEDMAQAHSAHGSAEKPADETRTVIPLVIKADVSGTIEAIEHELKKIPVPEERVVLRIVSKGVGPISESDVKLLAGSERGLIVGFNVGIDGAATELAERTGIATAQFSIIYELSKWLAEAITHRTPSITVEETTGAAKVLKYFSAASGKHVIGARVETGKITLHSTVKIVRRGIEVGKGKVFNLQEHKSDVKEVLEGSEFGAQITFKESIAPGDMLEEVAMVTH